MNETIPTSINSIDLRFVERDGKRILQYRRGSPTFYRHSSPGVFCFVWGAWEDVRVEKEQ